MLWIEHVEGFQNMDSIVPIFSVAVSSIKCPLNT